MKDLRIPNFILLLIILHPINSFAQEATSDENKKDIGISLGYIHQHDNFINIGLMVGKNVGNIHVPGWAYGVASEIGLGGSSIVGAKVYFDVNLIAFGFRVNSITYFKGSSTDFRVTPEIGLTWNNLLNIYYGYNVPVGGSEFNEIGRSRLNITGNLFRHIYD